MIALETENRRRSALSFGVVMVLPQAGGSIDAGDRGHVVGVYRGLFEVVVPPQPGVEAYQFAFMIGSRFGSSVKQFPNLAG